MMRTVVSAAGRRLCTGMRLVSSVRVLHPSASSVVAHAIAALWWPVLIEPGTSSARRRGQPNGFPFRYGRPAAARSPTFPCSPVRALPRTIANGVIRFRKSEGCHITRAAFASAPIRLKMTKSCTGGMGAGSRVVNPHAPPASESPITGMQVIRHARRLAFWAGQDASLCLAGLVSGARAEHRSRSSASLQLASRLGWFGVVKQSRADLALLAGSPGPSGQSRRPDSSGTPAAQANPTRCSRPVG
jgi:hypothetical protein